MMWKRAIVSPALLAACFFASSCGDPSSRTTRGDAKPSEPVTEVTVSRVVAEKLNTTVRLPAQLMPYEVVDVSAKVTGFVKWIKVDRGSRVKAGELIAQLEAPELIAQRAEAQAKLQSAESQLAASQAKLNSDRSTYEKLKAAAVTPGVVAKNDLIVAEEAVQADSAQLKAAGDNVGAAKQSLQSTTEIEGYLQVRAPFDGVVTERDVHPGALVGPAGGPAAMTPMVKIQTVNRDRLVVPVPEYDTAGIPEGTTVRFTVPSFPGRIFQAPIARISDVVDIKTRTMPVELDVKDPRGQLSPGIFCEVEWPVRRTYPTLFVPSSAITTDLERTFVIRVLDSRVEWVDVKTGMTTGNLTEVFGNLRAGDTVLARGTAEIRPGSHVTERPVSPESNGAR